MAMQLSRREFLKAAAGGTAALVIGINPKGALAAGAEGTDLNPFVRIDSDGVVTVIVKHFEMGQGTTTGLTTLIADELDADWEKVKTEYAPADNKRYANLFYKVQGTGGSTAIANSFMQYRQAGATARELLVRAAAQQWGVPTDQIRVDKGIIRAGSRQGHFGEFIAVASTLTPAQEPPLKTPDQFTLIGKLKVPRKDNLDKTDGSAKFAMDIQVPGMVYAVLLRSPKFGGTLQQFDDSAAKAVSGFVAAKAMPNKAGVVVYGKNTWAALQARKAITAQWDFAQAETRGSDELLKVHRELADSAPLQANAAFTTAQAQAKVAESTNTVEAAFSFPFLAHAPMEPLVCVLEPTDNGVRVHDGCQFPGVAHPAIAQALGLQPEQVEIHTLYAGGSFGRRATPVADYHVEAAMAFALLDQKIPVKMLWSREDDIRGGFYRPMAVHKAKIGLDAEGNILAWDHRTASKSIITGTPFEEAMVHNGIDHTAVEGVADTLYPIPNMALGVANVESPVTVLWWRSVGHTHTAFAMESLLDMVAHAAGKDPIEMRLAMLDKTDTKQRRLAGVIEAARDLAGWQPGQKRGFAAHFSFNTYVAVVADITANGDAIHVDKLHIAVDCGVAVNPDVIRAQMEGGAGFALGAVMRNEITLKDGEVVQSNFPDYIPLRMADMPRVSVTIVASAEAPTGVGEPAVPPTGPAVANAIFAVTGKRITDLPMTKVGVTFF